MTDQQPERLSYEQNAEFIRQSVERLEAGQVSIDELEGLAAEMSKAFSTCRERLARTRKAIAEVMTPSVQSDS